MLCRSEGEPRSDKWNGMLSETENTRTDGRKNYGQTINEKLGDSDKDLRGTGP